ncbi:MAG: 30S ribosomal protein S21 [Anaerolineae bacterium]
MVRPSASFDGWARICYNVPAIAPGCTADADWQRAGSTRPSSAKESRRQKIDECLQIIAIRAKGRAGRSRVQFLSRIVGDPVASQAQCTPGFFFPADLSGRREVRRLATVTLRDGESQESLLKRFRKEVMQERILSDARRKRWYISPSEMRRIQKQRAIRRARRRQRQREARQRY